jgi:hypothetical protein
LKPLITLTGFLVSADLCTCQHCLHVSSELGTPLGPRSLGYQRFGQSSVVLCAAARMLGISIVCARRRQQNARFWDCSWFLLDHGRLCKIMRIGPRDFQKTIAYLSQCMCYQFNQFCDSMQSSDGAHNAYPSSTSSS